MKVQTMSIIVGDETCNAKCPFCISKQTGYPQFQINDYIKLSKLKKSCDYARSCGAKTALITGKGEPTLHVKELLEYIDVANHYFPIVELQTNGLNIRQLYEKDAPYNHNNVLHEMKGRGLDTICISVVHWEDKFNHSIYVRDEEKQYPSLIATIKLLKALRFTIRLSCVGINGYIDNVDKLEQMIDFCRDNYIDQLTWRPVVSDSDKYKISDEVTNEICNEVAVWGTPLLDLMHGGIVYDVKGQNVCMTNCLTHSVDEHEVRQLIFYPDEKLRYSWKHMSAVIF
jgi:MoaA/NifB/PqqE/SkfB family radical SAM enzyme